MKILTNSTPLGLFLVYFLVMSVSLGGIHAQCGVNESEHPGDFTFSASGGTTIVPIESAGTNCNYSSWQFSTNASWVSVSLVNSNSMLIDCDPNTSNVDRTATVTITDNGEQMTFQVKSNAPLPPVPSITLSIIDNCSTATLSRSGSPPSGILWYWQTTSSGISTLFSGQTYTATVPNSTYYLRARNTSTNKWSNGAVSIVVNSIETPTTYYADSDNDGLRNPGSVGQQDCDFRGTGWTTNTTVDNCPDQYDPSNNCILAPPQPGSENTYNNCSSSVDLFAISENPPNGLTHIWYLNPTGPSQLAVSQITVMEDNQLEYITKVTVYQSESYWVASRSSSGQESERTEVKATFTTTDTTPPSLVLGLEDIPSPCGPTATFDISATGGGPGSIYRWYETSNTSGTPIFTGTDYSPTLNYNDTNNGNKTYWVRATLTSSNCYSGPDVNVIESITVSFQDPVPAPVATNQSFCGPNNFTLTASGAPSGGQYWWYNPDGSTAQISTSNSFSTGTITSTRTYQVSILVNGCEGPKVNVTASIEQIPFSPILGNVAQATCNNAYGTFDITNYNASYTYSVNPSSGVSIDGSTITAPSGITYTVTADNGSCSSAPSNSMTLDGQPTTPDIPELEIVSQPTCSVANGSFVITNYNSAYSYTLSPSNGVSRSGGTVTASPGTYTVTATLGECTSTGSDSLTVDVPPPSQTWYSDIGDGDGLGDPNVTLVQCIQPEGYVSNSSDNCPGIYDPSNACTPPSSDPSDHNYIYTRTYQYESTMTIDPQRFVQNDTLVQEIAFFDGLGRPNQQVGLAQTPRDSNGDTFDVVTHIGYDGFGRQEKEWLPYVDAQGNLGSLRTGAEADVDTYYVQNYGNDVLPGSPNPFSQKEFEPSPLSRVLKQAAPGDDWMMGNGHEIVFEYQANTHDPLDPTNADNDNVRLFTVDISNGYEAPELMDSGYYGANELYKTITYDENYTTGKNHSAEEFTDKQGRVVLKRTYADMDLDGNGTIEAGEGEAEVKHDTYYVYDDFGNLTYVLPPKMDATSATLATLEGQLDELGYQYVYDYRNRLVEKKIPGKGWEYVVYNKLDQPIMTQDSQQRASGEWLFTKYDAFGRVAFTGKSVEMENGNPSSRQAVQSLADAISGAQWMSRDTGFGMDNITVEYDNAGYPSTSITEVLTVNYYDDYGFDLSDEPAPPSTVFDASLSGNVKGLGTGSKVKVLDPNAGAGQEIWITTITRYDEKGRPIYTYSENDYLGTMDIMETLLDFTGKPVKTRTSHTRGTETVVTIDNFEYDHVGRLLKQTQCIGDATFGYSCGETMVEADLELLDPSITTNQTATSSIEVKATNNPVTLSGTLTLRVDANAGSGGGASSDEELIAYNKYDDLGQLVQKKVGGAPGADYEGTDGLQTVDYAYNVRGWLKQINDPANLGGDLFAFSIAYNAPVNFGGNENPDPLYNGNISQIQWSTASINTSGNPVSERYSYSYDALNRIIGAVDNTGNYDVSGITFDKNGNIMTLARDGWQNSATFAGMDVLDYDYGNGNRLLKVADIGNGSYGFKDGVNTGNDYRYDPNGNLVMDKNKGIGTDTVDGIEYNHLNLPTKVIVDNGSDSGTLDYVYTADGIKLQKIKTEGGITTTTDYNGNYIYENGILQFFNNPEGYVSVENGDYSYVYHYKDHLGNVRLSYTDNNGTLEIVEENNYYPFGLKHKGYNEGVSPLGNSTAKKFRYNGKELEESFGLNLYEMDMRQYDPAIARWTSIDPITHHSQSTYTGYDNNPVFWSDPSGANVIIKNGGNSIKFTGQDAIDAFRIIQQNSGGSDGSTDDEQENCCDGQDTDSQEDPKVHIVSSNPDEFKGVDRLSLFNVSGDQETISRLLGLFPYGDGVPDGEIRAGFVEILLSAVTLGGSRVSRFSRAAELVDEGSSARSIGSLELLPMNDIRAVKDSQDRLFEFEAARAESPRSMALYSMNNNLVLIYTDKKLFDSINYNETSNINELESFEEGFQNSEVRYIYSGVHYGNGLINVIDVQKIE